MTHSYNITGMTCTGCQAKVQGLLSKIEGITGINIDLPTGDAVINMDTHINTSTLQAALKDYPKYKLSEIIKEPLGAVEDENESWLLTYKPILLIFGYLLIASLLAEYGNGYFSIMSWMNHFMAGFFLVFSFFKFLNLKGFAESYAMYDVVARKWKGWGYAYAFVELLLGIAYLVRFNSLVTNLVTVIIMSISIIGVLQSVLNKRKIKCACLGDVFNLPMSTLTIIEDALMIAMSVIMLLLLHP